MDSLKLTCYQKLGSVAQLVKVPPCRMLIKYSNFCIHKRKIVAFAMVSFCILQIFSKMYSHNRDRVCLVFILCSWRSTCNSWNKGQCYKTKVFSRKQFLLLFNNFKISNVTKIPLFSTIPLFTIYNRYLALSFPLNIMIHFLSFKIFSHFISLVSLIYFPLNRVAMLMYQEKNDFATSAIVKSLKTSTTIYLCAGKTPLKLKNLEKFLYRKC